MENKKDEMSMREATDDMVKKLDEALKGIENLFIESDRVRQMQKIQAEVLELFKKKNADYGDAFAEFGVPGVLVRMNDKLRRYISVSKNGVNLVNTESLRDTLLDLHNYAALAIMLMDEKKDEVN